MGVQLNARAASPPCLPLCVMVVMHLHERRKSPSELTSRSKYESHTIGFMQRSLLPSLITLG